MAKWVRPVMAEVATGKMGLTDGGVRFYESSRTEAKPVMGKCKKKGGKGKGGK